MIHVLALIETTPGHRDDFLREFAKVTVPVRQEQGCIEYGAAVDAVTDIPVQQQLGENSVMIVEKWESVDHLKAHLVAPHMADYRIRVKAFVKSVELKILDPKA